MTNDNMTTAEFGLFPLHLILEADAEEAAADEADRFSAAMFDSIPCEVHPDRRHTAVLGGRPFCAECARS